MNDKLIKSLGLKYEPVAIFFTDEKPDNALQFEEGKRGCVASMLVAAATKGKTAVFDEKTYGCPGGGVGICFGDAFTANDHPTEYLLSTGDEALERDNKSIPIRLGRGERFFGDTELVKKWKSQMPYAEAGRKYVVFKPYSQIPEDAAPDLIFLLADPDQISALVIMSGFDRGTSLNVIAPFGAACHSILYAYNEINEESPKGIMGFFDIAQRNRIPRDLLSFTVPYSMYLELEQSVDESCLTTDAWFKLRNRDSE